MSKAICSIALTLVSGLLFLSALVAAGAPQTVADFDYLIRASNILADAALKGDALTGSDAVAVANAMCNAMSRLASDKDFGNLLERYANLNLKPEEREGVERVLNDVAKFANFTMSEFHLLREAGLSEGAANVAIGQLWSVRTEILAYKIEPRRVTEAIRQAADEVCKSKDAVKSRKEFYEQMHFYIKVVGGTILVVNSILGPPTLGSLIVISIGGGVLGVIFT
jgi:hypothetical protein